MPKTPDSGFPPSGARLPSATQVVAHLLTKQSPPFEELSPCSTDLATRTTTNAFTDISRTGTYVHPFRRTRHLRTHEPPHSDSANQMSGFGHFQEALLEPLGDPAALDSFTLSKVKVWGQ